MAPCARLGKMLLEGVQDMKGKSGKDEGKIEWKSCDINTKPVSRGQNKLIGKFQRVASDVISIRG